MWEGSDEERKDTGGSCANQQPFPAFPLYISTNPSNWGKTQRDKEIHQLFFPWICHLSSELLSPVHPEKSQSQVFRTCKKYHVPLSLQYYNNWRLDLMDLMVMGRKFQKPFIISVLPEWFTWDCIKWWLFVVWSLISRRILFKAPLPKINKEICFPCWKQLLILGSIGNGYY